MGALSDGGKGQSMMLESLANSDSVARISERFAKAVAFLRRPDLATLADGKYPIDGETVFASVQGYITKPHDQCAWEAHRKYADVQYIIEGREAFGYAPLELMRVTQAYNAARDVMFLEGAGVVIPVDAGNLLVFAPHDAHRPCLAAGDPMPIRKVVVKVAVS
jgi:YhcH/YjgK/YiaL family protein